MNGSLSLFRESTEDNKNVLLQSALPNYNSPVSSRASNCLDQVRPMQKSETAPACRLFGFDLRNKIPPPLEKEVSLLHPSTNPDCDSLPKKPETEGKQGVDILASLKERKEAQMESPTNDIQGFSPPSRTRIKVTSTCLTVF